ncbi:HAD family hydrolase [Stakelama saccharophila]|uniref:phosphoserine phosphatase n=1 Tax=Stakelama saccharophila TaxID=3075605 RepID=A0ABZ0B9H4_9SPHN|nr:HAD family hydrolase [Stakelama sp. W311]WNO53761.1 HAD family hydrolase [Stakelama sp. W311]
MRSSAIGRPRRAKIETAIKDAPADSYAVFDADNTIWDNDLEEALLPFLEQRGELSPATLPQSLRPVPLHDGETLYGYYRRLCAIHDKICYPWIAQVFAGRSLSELKRDVDALLARRKPIPVRYEENGRAVRDTVSPPRIRAAQKQLIAELKAKGVHVYVVTAAAEELVRMVVSDPKYGIGIAPEDVIGVTMLLRDPKDSSVTTARRQIAMGHFLDDRYPAEKHARMILTSSLWSPLTWYEGKVAGIQAYIDPVRRPLLVAGDSRSDWSMLFYSGGLRLWVNRSDSTTAELAVEKKARAAAQHATKTDSPLPADAGWLEVAADALDR